VTGSVPPQARAERKRHGLSRALGLGSAKLGQVSGRMFQAINDYYPRWVLYPTLIGVILGNTIEAGADLGGMAAALNLYVPVPGPWLCLGIAIIVLALQVYGSYVLIRKVFRWLALVLLAYLWLHSSGQPGGPEVHANSDPELAHSPADAGDAG